MRFQSIIIGGGLAGLSAGIKLAEAGRKVAIVSSGQSTLHFFSGSLELLGSDGESDIIHPFDAIDSLNPSHPYSRIGAGKMRTLADEAILFFRKCGLRFVGGGNTNCYHITPFGVIKPSWLSLDDCLTFESPEKFPYKTVGIANISGYLDFYPQFLSLGLGKIGVNCKTMSVTSPQLQALRKSSTEMRAANMARVMTPETVDCIAAYLNGADAAIEAFILPAIFGMNDTVAIDNIRAKTTRPVFFIPTMPTSVPGVRAQIILRSYFKKLGGIYLLGDSVTGGQIANGRMRNITTTNLGSDRLEGDDFILATGSFLSHGIKATPDRVYEPVLNLDVASKQTRAGWFKENFYESQPYMDFGVVADDNFRLSRSGEIISNLYGVGAVLGGCDPITLCCGGGVALFTALHVADMILNNK